jgi:hypothetical protein
MSDRTAGGEKQIATWGGRGTAGYHVSQWSNANISFGYSSRSRQQPIDYFSRNQADAEYDYDKRPQHG